MGGDRKRREPLFLAVFTLLTILSLLLVAFTVYIFLPEPAWAQIDAWARARFLPTGPAQEVSGSLPDDGAGETTSAPVIHGETPRSAARENLPTYPPMNAVGGAVEVEVTPPAPEPNPLPPITIYEVVEKQPPAGTLAIPALELEQRLLPVEVQNGEWLLDDLGARVGWLDTTGAHPGDDLAMVVVGHITLPPPGGNGPFLNLRSLKPGDLIEYRAAGETFVYRVQGQTVVTPQDVETLYREDGSKLLLVTCTGYNALERRYDRRLLVEAELVTVNGSDSQANQQ